MSFAEWAMIRSVGNYVGNVAYSRERQEQLLREKSGSHTLRLADEFIAYERAGGNLDLESWLRKTGNLVSEEIVSEQPNSDAQMRADVAEMVHGKSDPVFEKKWISFARRFCEASDYLNSLSSIPLNNAARLAELMSIVVEFVGDPGLDHLARADLRNETDYTGALYSSMEQLRDCFSYWFPDSDAPHEVLEYMKEWLERSTDHMWISGAFYEVMEGHPAVTRKNNFSLELDWGSYQPPEQATKGTNTCLDCGGLVSKSLMACPHCGGGSLSSE